jgi:hypothetical protein
MANDVMLLLILAGTLRVVVPLAMVIWSMDRSRPGYSHLKIGRWIDWEVKNLGKR